MIHLKYVKLVKRMLFLLAILEIMNLLFSTIGQNRLEKLQLLSIDPPKKLYLRQEKLETLHFLSTDPPKKLYLRQEKLETPHFLSTDPPKKLYLRPWYLTNGTDYPTGRNPTKKLWPEESTNSDRIHEQLMYSDVAVQNQSASNKMKQILLLGSSGDGLEEGQYNFIQLNCPVNSCQLGFTSSKFDKVDLVVTDEVLDVKIGPPNQLWMIYLLESPLNTVLPWSRRINYFNFTSTYRRDSDIVSPYYKWTYYNPEVRSIPNDINHAKGKIKQVAWFVSNCLPQNNRGEYVVELQKYIPVDVYGRCGSLLCSRKEEALCFQKLSTEYKFYLAFENSNCRDYITEKFFYNGLQNDVLPIVMGAHPDDYRAVAPLNSYIHVEEFQTPKDLANYLHYLDQNDTAYNEYFQWKGTGEFAHTRFLCRVCAMIHHFDLVKSKNGPRYIEDFRNWWEAPGKCLMEQPFRWSKYSDSFYQSNSSGSKLISTNGYIEEKRVPNLLHIKPNS